MARGLSDEVIKVINEEEKFNCLRNIFKEAKLGTIRNNPLLVCLRDNKIDVYYNGCPTINIDVKGGMLNGSIGKYYTLEEIENNDIKVNKESNKNSSNYRIYEEDINICTIDKMTKFVRGKNERAVQQQIIMCNNETPNAEWYCVDMEYNSGKYGEFDIIAISRKENCKGKHELAVIELKVGYRAMGTNEKDLPEGFKDKSKLLENESEWSSVKGSGITGHFSKFIGFLNDEQKVEELKEDVLKIIETYYKTPLCDDNVKKIYEAGKKKAIIFDEPKIIFLNYTDAKSKLASLKKGFINNVTENDYSIKKVWNGDILKKYNDRFLCVFRDKEYGSIFSDIEISEAKNLFDVEAYR